MFRLLAVTDVTHNAGEGSAGTHQNFTDGQFHGKYGPIFSLTDQLPVGPKNGGGVSGQVSLKIRIMFLLIRRRHQKRHISTNGFLGGIAKHLLSRMVEGLDDPALIDGDDGIGCRIHDATYSRIAFLASQFPPFAFQDPSELRSDNFHDVQQSGIGRFHRS